MFGIKRNKEALATLVESSAPAQEITPEHEAQDISSETVNTSLGRAALPEVEVAGFHPHESGILVPSEGIKLSGEVLVTDRRRVTMESVEANFKAEQERLNSPLDFDEMNDALDKIEVQMRDRIAGYSGDDGVYRDDIQRDPAALHRVRNVISGRNDVFIERVVKPGEELSNSEKLNRVIAAYAKLVPENFAPDTHIGSMGGTVSVPEDGVIHCDGYNGSILYDFARAKQILDKVEANPKDVREKITEAAGEVDASWLYEEPVVVDPSLTKVEAAA